MKNYENVPQNLDLVIIILNYQLKDNPSITEMLKNYTMA
jgi:hypothetical protein